MNAYAVNFQRLQLFHGRLDESLERGTVEGDLAVQYAPRDLDRKPDGVGFGAPDRLRARVCQLRDGRGEVPDGFANAGFEALARRFLSSTHASRVGLARLRFHQSFQVGDSCPKLRDFGVARR